MKLLICLGILILLDGLTTMVVLEKGGIEMNPLLSPLQNTTLMAIKIEHAIVFPAIFALLLKHRRNEKVVKAVVLLITCVYLITVTNNFIQLAKADNVVVTVVKPPSQVPPSISKNAKKTEIPGRLVIILILLLIFIGAVIKYLRTPPL